MHEVMRILRAEAAEDDAAPVGDLLAVAALWSMERRRRLYGEIPASLVVPVS